LRFSKPPPSATRPQLRCGGYARHRGEPQAADCAASPSGPISCAGFERRTRFACFLCNSFKKPRPEGFPHAVFMLRVQEASVTFRSRRRGAPEVVRSWWFSRVVRRNSRCDCGRGEGLRGRAVFPGDVPGGYGEPARLLRLRSNTTYFEIFIASGPERYFRRDTLLSCHAGRQTPGWVFQCFAASNPSLRETPYLSGMSSASAAVDSMKLGGQSSAASLSSRCASFLFFFSRANSPL
jgi:hypothetical protein